MRKFINSYEYEPGKHGLRPTETNNQPSMTVPDVSMSIKTIMERYSRGLPINAQMRNMEYNDSDLPDPTTLDLAERQELREQFSTELNELNARKKAYADEQAAKKQKEAEEEADFKKALKEAKNTSKPKDEKSTNNP